MGEDDHSRQAVGAFQVEVAVPMYPQTPRRLRARPMFPLQVVVEVEALVPRWQLVAREACFPISKVWVLHRQLWVEGVGWSEQLGASPRNCP